MSLWFDHCTERADAYEQEGMMMHLNQAPGQALQEASAASGAQMRRTETRLSGRVLVIARAIFVLIALFEMQAAPAWAENSAPRTPVHKIAPTP